jgi:hypothetical protein
MQADHPVEGGSTVAATDGSVMVGTVQDGQRLKDLSMLVFSRIIRQ